MAARRTRRAAAAAATGLFAAACAALVLAAVPAAAAASATTPTTLPLSEGPWKLANANGSLSYSDIAIPAYPHQVLQSKGVIADPLYRYNELLTRWVCDDTWTYSREFVASPAQAASPAADLVFKGLDTFATVTLNGDVILRADNFHRTWRVPVQGLLKAGKNTLTIALEPAEATAVRLKREMPYTVNALHQPGGMDIYNYARKGAYSFGWDWGASFPISGIHGEIDLVTYDAPMLVGAHIVSQHLVDAPAGPVAATLPAAASATPSPTTPTPTFKIDVEAEFAVPPTGGKGDLFVDLDLGNGKHVTASTPVDIPAPTHPRAREDFLGAVHVGGREAQGASRDKALKAGKAFARLTLDVPASEVRLWWPAGLGAQPLYNLTAAFRPAEGSMDCGAAMAAGKGDVAAAAAAAAAAALDLATPFYRRAPPSGPPPRAAGDEALRAASHRHASYAVGEACTAVRRRLGFRTMELVTDAGPRAAQGDLKASWQYSPAKNSPEAQALRAAEKAAREAEAAGEKPAVTATPSAAAAEEARLLKATQAAKSAWPDWGLYDGQWLFFELPPKPRDPAVPLEGYNFSAPPSLLARPTVDDGRGAKRQAVVTDGQSESFFLRVNGVPVFAKGGNVIPMTLFPTTDTYAQIERTLGAALAAHHNMVRVWGGGVYPSDAFHDYADEHGLMVWEEAMFACTLYPTGQPGFLSNVEAELEEQVRRLAGRPAVAVWAGNNEVEGSFDWFAPSRDNRMLYAVDYHELFVRTIGGTVADLAPYLPYVDSSPMNGYVSRPQPGEYGRGADKSSSPPIKRWGRSGDERYGDVHFYNYAFDCQSAREFPQSKFVSEFGFLSVPNFATWAEATDPTKGDWEFGNFSPTEFGVNNTMTNFRSRRYSHIQEILNQAGRHFRLPAKWRLEAKPGASPRAQATAKRETQRLYKQFFWLTNQQQAACYKTGTAAWRRQRSEANALTMGVLYWQLNDVWAGWSWSGYDWAGRWKPMHYALQREFMPLVSQVWYDPNADRMEVFLVSDEPVAIEDAKVVITLRRILYGAQSEDDCKTGRPSAVAKTWTLDNVAVPAAASSRVWSMAADDVLAAVGEGEEACTRTRCYLTAEVEARYPEAGGEAVAVALAEAGRARADAQAQAKKAAEALKTLEAEVSSGRKTAKNAAKGVQQATEALKAAEAAVAALPQPRLAANAARPRLLKSEGEAFFTYWKGLDYMPEAYLNYNPLRFVSKAKAARALASGGIAVPDAASDPFSDDRVDNRTVAIELKEARGATAVLVTLDAGKYAGHFSENGFTLHAAGDGVDGRSCEEGGKLKTVFFHADEPIADLADFDNQLGVTSLFEQQPILVEELAPVDGAPAPPPPHNAPEGDTPVG